MKQTCRVCNLLKELNTFPKNYSYRLGVATICKMCSALQMYKYRKENEYKYKAQKFRTSVEEIQKLFMRNECHICGKVDKRRKLSIDHCHSTNRIRGLLCDNCNKGLGLFKDDPTLLLNAVQYLGKYATSVAHGVTGD